MLDATTDLEIIFSIAGLLAMAGWILLLASPFIPIWSDRIAGIFIPVMLSVGYVVVAFILPSDESGGGFNSLAEVMTLFSKPTAMLAGWVHYLAFDLLIGAWICRIAREEGVRFWFIIPCLPLTFLFGPAGFLVFSFIRFVGWTNAKRHEQF